VATNYHRVNVTAGVHLTDFMCGSRRCLQSWHGMHCMQCLSIIFTFYILYILLHVLLLILNMALEANYCQFKSTHCYGLICLLFTSISW